MQVSFSEAAAPLFREASASISINHHPEPNSTRHIVMRAGQIEAETLTWSTS